MNAILLVVFVGTLAISSAKILKLAPDAQVVPGEYVVVLKAGVDARKFISSQVLRRNDGELSALENNVQFVYKEVYPGFSAKLDESELNALDSFEEVDYISPNQIFTINAVVTQPGAEYGLARLSQKLPVSGTNGNYRYDDIAGNGVSVYVVDTGIYIQHNDFGGRAVQGANYVTGESNEDLNGHGTHCAGTVGGSVYGVAKRARLVAVKVLNGAGSGTLAAVISGIEFAVSNSTGNRANAVISMSLGASSNAAVDQAANSAVSNGVTTVVAAGNSGANACNFSPAGAASAITVAASGQDEAQTSWSNWGPCVDIIAPGLYIKSAWPGSQDATNTISGTSMATPHVAGLVAYLQSVYNYATPALVDAAIKSYAQNGAISNVPASQLNALAQNDVSN